MDSEKPRSIGSIATRMVFTFVALLLLYPLSSGPTAMLMVLTRHGDRTWTDIYGPLAFVAAVTHTMPALNAYLDWWTDIGHRIRPPEKVDDLPAIP